jgi:hypothetical protein
MHPQVSWIPLKVDDNYDDDDKEEESSLFRDFLFPFRRKVNLSL